MVLKQLTNQEFNNFVDNFKDKSIYQTSEYGFIMNNQNFDCVLLGLENDGIIIAASLMLIEKKGSFKYAYAPKGFLINYEDFYLFKEFSDHIKEYLSKLGIIAIKINPLIIKNIYDFKNQILTTNQKYPLILESLIHNGYHHLGYNNFFESLKPRFEAVIDINLSEEVLFKNIKKEYRTKIRSAIKNGVKVFIGQPTQINELYEFTKDKYIRGLNYLEDCYGYFTKRNMIDYYYTKLDTDVYLRSVQQELNKYEILSNKLNNEIMLKAKRNPQGIINKKMNIDKYLNKYQNELVLATKLLRQHPNGIITSAILLVKLGNEVTILIDGDNKEFRRLNSKHLLIWQLIQNYKKQGFTKFNLGGTSNYTVDVNKYVGLDNFKINFGSKMIEYIGDLELIINKRHYSLFKNYIPLKNLIKGKPTK